MVEIRCWIAQRYEFDTKLMKQAAREWWSFAFVLMPLGAGVLALLCGLASYDDVRIFDALRAQIPGWLGPAAYIAFWLGFAAATYAWLVKGTARRLAHL